MECRQVEPLLALWVGNDLESGHDVALQQHLELCPQCRERSRQLVVAETALQEARLSPVAGESLWPRVRAKLREWERRPQFAKFNVWVPTAIAAVACSLMVMVASVEVQRKVQHWVVGPGLTSSLSQPLLMDDSEVGLQRAF
jgi:hypothetical protein